MPRLVFEDIDEFADHSCGPSGRFIQTSRPSVEWAITAWPLQRIEVQSIQVGAAATWAGVGRHDHATIILPADDSQAEVTRIDGRVLGRECLLRVPEKSRLTYSAPVPTRWILITLPLCRTADRDAVARIRVARMRGRATIQRLRALLARMHLAFSQGSPSPSLAAAEEEIEEVITRLLDLDAREDVARPSRGRPMLQRDRIISRCLELFAAHRAEHLSVEDLAIAIGVTDRTLRSVFDEYFCVGPMHLLRAHRLHVVRQRLLDADHRCSSIFEAAADCGIGDGTHYSRQYKALFGESPSATLQRARRCETHGIARRTQASWADYAALCFTTGWRSISRRGG